MDEMWVSRLHSSKHYSSHSISGNEAMLDNSEVNEDASTYFTCPFCYVDTELSMLCDHLQEHCFDVNNAVCPVCALNLGKDVASHFKMHHSNSIKKRSQKSGFWSFYAGRNMAGGLSAKSGMENVNGSAPDPLLSPFLFNAPYSDSKGDESQRLCSSKDASFIPVIERSKPLKQILNLSELEGDSEEMKQKAEFCKQLIFSTML